MLWINHQSILVDSLVRFQPPWRYLRVPLSAATPGYPGTTEWKPPCHMIWCYVWLCLYLYTWGICSIHCSLCLHLYKVGICSIHLLYIYMCVIYTYSFIFIYCVLCVSCRFWTIESMDFWVTTRKVLGVWGPNVSSHGNRIADLEQFEQGAQIQLSPAGW